MVDRNVGGYHVSSAEAGTMRAAEVERRMAQEQARAQQAQSRAHNDMLREMQRNQNHRASYANPVKPSPRARKPANKIKSTQGDFSALFAIGGFLLTLAYLSNAGFEGGELYTGSVIGGVLAGALYQIILAAIGVVLAALIFSSVSDAASVDFTSAYPSAYSRNYQSPCRTAYKTCHSHTILTEQLLNQTD